MTRKYSIRVDYFNWLINYIRDDCNVDPDDYTMMLNLLFDREFYWSIPLDENRALDGLGLRDRFIEDSGYFYRDVYGVLPEYCTVLEMMIALCSRCEDAILFDTDSGNHTGQLFWIMIQNLELYSFSDQIYDEEQANDIIDIFLDRNYERNGRGGLVYLEHPRKDMRTVEIWYQVCWFLNEFLGLNN